MKNILVIGGSTGIGAALVSKCAGEGHQVFATYFKNTPTAAQGINFYPYNVLENGATLPFIPEVLHGLVYCPGSILLRPFSRIQATDFIEDYKLNVTGAIQVIQAALPALKRADSAAIVLFSTVAVQLGLNFHTQVAASKGAVEGLTRALAAELSPRVRVNCIAPSLTDTPLAATLLSTDEKKDANAQRHPLKRIGTPHEIAALAAFLLGDDAAWITGQVIHADGGISRVKV